jgi:SAM-dependent methyltransferase
VEQLDQEIKGDSLRRSESFKVKSDPVAQWLDWEQQANLVGFRTSTAPVKVDVVAVPRSAVETHVLPGAPSDVLDLFLRGDRVLVPRHPLNRDPTVAFSDAPVAEQWTARFTSSRTLAFPGRDSGDALFSVKLATDHPHPSFRQPEKTKLRHEAIDAITWAWVLDRVDRLLGPIDPGIGLLPEMLIVLVAGRESGFLVRDLRLFQDGHYYLPALSLPFVGSTIAQLHGQTLDAFWGRCFAEPVGRAKACLLARYGLWFETPNPQNLLVQLDRELRPTGKLVFRDMGDGDCATDAKEAREVPWSKLEDDLRPETRTSFWAFDEAGEHSIAGAVLERWYALHDAAYYAELARWFPDLAPEPSVARERMLEHWNTALRSDAGEACVARVFAERMLRAASGS